MQVRGRAAKASCSSSSDAHSHPVPVHPIPASLKPCETPDPAAADTGACGRRVYIVACFLLVCVSALASGLTLAYFSLDKMELEVGGYAQPQGPSVQKDLMLHPPKHTAGVHRSCAPCLGRGATVPHWLPGCCRCSRSAATSGRSAITWEQGRLREGQGGQGQGCTSWGGARRVWHTGQRRGGGQDLTCSAGGRLQVQRAASSSSRSSRKAPQGLIMTPHAGLLPVPHATVPPSRPAHTHSPPPAPSCRTSRALSRLSPWSARRPTTPPASCLCCAAPTTCWWVGGGVGGGWCGWR